MTQKDIIIRKIQAQDNKAIAGVIKAVFIEVGLPLTGTAYEDADTTAMFEAYQDDKAVYFVIEQQGVVVGGAGIKALNDGNALVCELQKMYFSPQIRGLGLGQVLIQKCLQAARDFGFEKCYLESATQLKAAIHIYEKVGFSHLSQSLGNTGHFACGVFMLKDL